MIRNPPQFLTAISLAFLLLVTACSPSKTETVWEQVESESPAAVVEGSAEKVLPGSQFNRFFPPDGEGYARIYTQEKDGFAEAKLKQNGEELAMLSVSDTAANPAAAEKYRRGSLTIAGFPAATIGSTATGVLVGDRLQVKVLSRSDNFTTGDREAWLQKFDLAGLEGLVKQ